jgi:hypothetical protein
MTENEEMTASGEGEGKKAEVVYKRVDRDGEDAILLA